MADDPSLPEPDRIEGAPHPRETYALYGQADAEARFLAAHAGGKLHHAWLLAGPRGVGKATLAWRIARFLIAAPAQEGGGLFGEAPGPASLDMAPDHPVARRLAALSDPGLFLLRRGANDAGTGLSQVIRVEEVRRLSAFLHLSAADGGHRAVIIDSADEMNPQAQNALLKLLEEPPAGVTFLMVSHQPLSLLPTIRSRCRELRLAPLAPGDLAAALGALGHDAGAARALGILAGGSVGEAVRLAELDGLEAWRELVAVFSAPSGPDRARLIRLAERAGGRGNEAATDLLFRLADLLVARLALTGSTGAPPPEAVPGEAALLQRMASGPGAGRAWAGLHQDQAARVRHGRAVNLDPSALLLDTLLAIAETAGQAARA